jgi:hypothetical protein
VKAIAVGIVSFANGRLESSIRVLGAPQLRLRVSAAFFADADRRFEMRRPCHLVCRLCGPGWPVALPRPRPRLSAIVFVEPRCEARPRARRAHFFFLPITYSFLTFFAVSLSACLISMFAKRLGGLSIDPRGLPMD